jgi:exopolysaccharide biosynthesis polyprenyl glycosylphosphotransferase
VVQPDEDEASSVAVRTVADRPEQVKGGAARPVVVGPATRKPLAERVSALTSTLIGVDILAAMVAIVLAHTPRWWAVALATMPLVCRASLRIYRPRLRLSYLDDVPRAVAGTCAGFGLAVAAIMLFGSNGDVSKLVIHDVLIFLAVAEPLRAIVFHVARWGRRRFRRGDRTVVVGDDLVARELLATMGDHPEFGLRPTALVAPDDLATAIVQHRAGTVLLASASAAESETVDSSIVAHQLGCRLLLLPRMFELFHDAPDVERLRGYPLVRIPMDPTRRPSWLVKRSVDVVVAALCLALLAPVLTICAVAVLLETGRPVIFSQMRVGRGGRPFRIFKLRSVRPSHEPEGDSPWSVVGDTRVGPVGRFLRRTSLDELPQLWNVVCGDMSLVGPRPERPGFVEKFTASHARYWARHRVPVGLTGLAQVNGLRGDTSIADRARHDNYYIANWSLWLDVKIILVTVRELFRGTER